MNKQNIAIGIAVVALVLSAFGFVKNSGTFGSINVEDYLSVVKYEGYNSSKPITLSGADGDITVGGGEFTVSTSNTATSSSALGCVQTVATSTATPVRLVLTNNLNATTTYGGTGFSTTGLVGWQYGSCPR